MIFHANLNSELILRKIIYKYASEISSDSRKDFHTFYEIGLENKKFSEKL